MAAAGRRIGPYEVVSALGAGGMGEVYRARDSRLGRDVAVKVLPADRSADPDRLRRFEQEARAVAALNHPNILAVYDVGTDEGAPYVVFELLEGETLRRRLGQGAIPLRKAVEHTLQICRGLSAAHAHGIVHRDIKPENLFLTRDSQVKILDFGLAKLTEPADKGLTDAPTDTAPHSLLGTAGYMSPEQVRGLPLDSRSDLFSLGAVLYEMLSGRRAFEGTTSADTLTAILQRDPPEVVASGERLPAGIDRIMRRCLEKDAEERFQTARDLAFALEAVSGSSQAESAFVPAAPSRRAWLHRAVAGSLVVAVAATAYVGGVRHASRPLPTYKQLTSRRGVVLDDARFTADGATVVYSALWDGGPPETFTTRLDTPESVPLRLPPARLLSVSAQGEAAILLANAENRQGDWVGTLARVPVTGGTPREVTADVLRADWSPDGRELAIVRFVDGRARLEFPIGRVLRDPVSTADAATTVRLRVSPRGDRVALQCDDGLLVVDRAGQATKIKFPGPIWSGPVWAPSGDALWVVAATPVPEAGVMGSEALWHLTLDDKAAEVARLPQHLFLHDVSRDGRFLIHLGAESVSARAKASGEAAERDVSVFDASLPAAISADGAQLLLGAFSNLGSGAFLRPMRGGAAVRLAEAWPLALSPDSRWMLGDPTDGSQFVLTPVRAGEPRSLSSAGLHGVSDAWFADAGHVLFNATATAGHRYAFVLDLQAGKPSAVTPEGELAIRGSLVGGRFMAYGPDGSLAWLALSGGGREAISARVPKGAQPLQLSADRRFLFVGQDGVPGRIDRIDLVSGRRIPWKTVMPEDPAGVYLVWAFNVTPDGQAYAFSYQRYLHNLYVVEGLQ